MRHPIAGARQRLSGRCISRLSGLRLLYSGIASPQSRSMRQRCSADCVAGAASARWMCALCDYSAADARRFLHAGAAAGVDTLVGVRWITAMKPRCRKSTWRMVLQPAAQVFRPIDCAAGDRRQRSTVSECCGEGTVTQGYGAEPWDFDADGLVHCRWTNRRGSLWADCERVSDFCGRCR